jgi:hypothetical protein
MARKKWANKKKINILSMGIICLTVIFSLFSFSFVTFDNLSENGSLHLELINLQDVLDPFKLHIESSQPSIG